MSEQDPVTVQGVAYRMMWPPLGLWHRRRERRGCVYVILSGNFTHMNDETQNSDPWWDISIGLVPLGDTIRSAREEKGVSRTALARIVGISHNSMLKYEKAGYPDGQYPSLPVMTRIARHLELDPRELFDRSISDPNVIAPMEAKSFRFSDHFRTDEEWLNFRISIRDADDLSAAIHSIHYDIYRNTAFLKNIAETMSISTESIVDETSPVPINNDRKEDGVENSDPKRKGGPDEPSEPPA